MPHTHTTDTLTITGDTLTIETAETLTPYMIDAIALAAVAHYLHGFPSMVRALQGPAGDDIEAETGRPISAIPAAAIIPALQRIAARRIVEDIAKGIPAPRFF